MTSRPLRLTIGMIGALAAATPLVAQTTASPFTTGTRYDESQRVTGVILPDPDDTGPIKFGATRNSYDEAGRLRKTETGELASWQSQAVAPAAWSGFTVFRTLEIAYDAMSRKSRETVKGSDGATYAVTQYSYDIMGRLECTAVRMNPAVFGALPASACTLGTQGSQGPDRITRNLYDAMGQLLQVRRGVGTGLEQAYVTTSYTANGKPDYIIDAKGQRARQTWDGFDRAAQWQLPSTTVPSGYNPATPATALASAGPVNTADYEAYGYDLSDNRTSLRKRDGRTIDYSYDVLDRLSVKTVPDGGCSAPYSCTAPPASATRDVYYSYDMRGLQTAARFDSASGSDAVLSAWDGFGRLTSSTTAMNGLSQTLGYLYDADGNRVRITHPDGVFFTTMYDGLDRATYVNENGSSNLVWYAYNAQGLRASRNAYSTTLYGYDPVQRLASLTQDMGAGTWQDMTAGFSYNPAGQMTGRTQSNGLYSYQPQASGTSAYAANGLNQYASVAGGAYSYDSSGNLLSGGGVTYAFDAENRLIGASGARNATLVYDPLGRLRQTGVPGAPTTLLQDAEAEAGGERLVLELDHGGGGRRYVHGPGVDEPAVWYELGAPWPQGVRWYGADHQGSVVTLTDGSGVAAINRYDPYGQPAGTNLGRFQYTGQLWLAELGLYHYKARAYSPVLGRFLQVDPIGYDDQQNLYAYVGNDPANESDPSGNGRLKWFIEKAGGGWKRVSERIARRRLGRDGNVEVRGPGRSREGRRMADKVYGDSVRHDPHPSLPSNHKGRHQPHDQPTRAGRKTFPNSHVYHTFLGAISTGFATVIEIIDEATDPFSARELAPAYLPRNVAEGRSVAKQEDLSKRESGPQLNVDDEEGVCRFKGTLCD